MNWKHIINKYPIAFASCKKYFNDDQYASHFYERIIWNNRTLYDFFEKEHKLKFGSKVAITNKYQMSIYDADGVDFKKICTTHWFDDRNSPEEMIFTESFKIINEKLTSDE